MSSLSWETINKMTLILNNLAVSTKLRSVALCHNNVSNAKYLGKTFCLENTGENILFKKLPKMDLENMPIYNPKFTD